MAEEKQGWISIDSCVADYIVESEQSNHKEYKLTNLAYRGMDEMGIDCFYRIKSVKLPVGANKIVYLPDDYSNYSKIGVFNSIGEVVPINYNEKLTIFADQLPDRQSKVEDNTTFDLNGLFNPSSPVFFNFWDGSGYVNLFGIPSGQPNVGSFKIDRDAGVIVLDPNFFFDYICLEYVATPKVGVTYRIPVQFREALISFLRWKDVISMPATSHMGMADKTYREKVFWNDRRNARARYKPTYLEEAFQWSLENQRWAVKA